MSIVKCYPVTGRTHQIRVHLQHLGYPIANDQMYSASKSGSNVEETRAPILNYGLKPYPSRLFDNAYQNEQQGGKKGFMQLWLHAYRYTIPHEIWGEKEDDKGELKVKTGKPNWALETYKFEKWEPLKDAEKDEGEENV